VKKKQTASKSAETARPARKTARPRKVSLAAEEESAAGREEPMGSIAAAVPGNDSAAQNAMESAQLPGAEAPEIRDRPQTTAGTEAKLE